jgi:hypothetical protein
VVRRLSCDAALESSGADQKVEVRLKERGRLVLEADVLSPKVLIHKIGSANEADNGQYNYVCAG